MAKASLVKMGLKVNANVNTIAWRNGEEVIEVEVKQYLPIEEKLQVISNIVNSSIDDNDFYNPVRLEIFTTLELIYAYTNLNITPKMKEDVFKLFDMIMSSGFYDKFLAAIPNEEFDMITIGAEKTIRNIYNYKNSAAGILHLISADYSNLDLDLTNLNDKITDPNSLAVLKEIAPMLGLNV